MAANETVQITGGTTNGKVLYDCYARQGDYVFTGVSFFVSRIAQIGPIGLKTGPACAAEFARNYPKLSSKGASGS